MPATCTQPAPLAHPAHAYTRLDYRQHYAALLRFNPSPAQAVAELCLFRCWLACRALRHVQAPHASGPTPSALPNGWPPPRQAGGIDIEPCLGRPVAQLLAQRFELYDRFSRLGGKPGDPLGLDAVAVAVSFQLFIEVPANVRDRLKAEIRELFDQLQAACAATPTSAPPCRT